MYSLLTVLYYLFGIILAGPYLSWSLGVPNSLYLGFSAFSVEFHPLEDCVLDFPLSDFSYPPRHGSCEVTPSPHIEKNGPPTLCTYGASS